MMLKYFLVVQDLSQGGAATLESVDFLLRGLELNLKKLEARTAKEGAAAAPPPLMLTAVQDGLGNSTLRFRGVGSPGKGPSRRPPHSMRPPVPAAGDKRPPERAPGESPATRRQAANKDAAPAADPPLQLDPGVRKKRLTFQATFDEGAAVRQEAEDRAAAAKAVAAENTIAGRLQPRATKESARAVSKSYAAAVRGEGSPRSPAAAAPPPPTGAPPAIGGGRPPVAHPAGAVPGPIFPSGLPNPAAGAHAAGLPWLVYMQHMAAFFSFQQQRAAALSGQAPQ